jgi:vitamin B12 transporter
MEIVLDMRKSYVALGAVALSQSIIASAEEVSAGGEVAILVTASRADEPLDASRYSGSATILSVQDLKTRQVRDVADVLRDVPGIAVSASPGLTQLRFRGSEGNHVLVLVDGIEAASAFFGEADIGTFQAEIGSSAEVLRGPQSALYGSDAIGGVFAYKTATGCELPGGTAYMEGGSHSTFNAAARAGICGDEGELALHATLVSTDGVPNTRGGTRNIGRDGLTLSAKGEVGLSPDLSLRAVGRYAFTDGDFNNQDFDPSSPTLGFAIDSPGVDYENEAIYALVGFRAETLEGRWTHDLSGQFADVSRDTFNIGQRDSGNEGQRLKASYVSTLNLVSPVFAHQVTFAADWERERYRNTDPSGFAFTRSRNARNFGLVGEYRMSADRFDLSAAFRHDINNRFADETTFRISGGVNAGKGTRLRASYGSGIKNPGFYQLYCFVDGRFIGNEDLKPEKSTGWEVGIDQQIADGGLVLSATDFIATPANRETDSTREGLELTARAKIGPQITLDAAYTWLDSEENGVEEVRRPGNIASAVLTWTAPGDRASASLILRHNGATDDVAFTDPSFIPVTVRLDDYTLVNLNARLQLTDRIEIFGRAENLFNETYEQVFSFVSQGRSVIAGIRMSL